MNKHQKVAVIIWTVDPEGERRFLLRHNKPFNGYEDEWTVVFGDVEKGEDLEKAARRESSEEFGINNCGNIRDLNYKIEFDGKHGSTEAHFISLRIKSIETPIRLNEESIGYDWMLIEKAKGVMTHKDEKKAFDFV